MEVETRSRRLRRAAVFVVAVAGSALSFGPAAGAGTPLRPLKPAKALERMEAGHRLDHVEVLGRINLDGMTLSRPFECTNCQFDGPVTARNAIFMRPVNFSGSIFARRVTMVGASFGAPASFGSPKIDSYFKQDADFTLATFGDLADFENVTFRKAATFVLTRFHGDTIFSVDAPIPGAFDGATSFVRAAFTGSADFRNQAFSTSPDFTRATFSARADFGAATFSAGATFEGTTFGQQTSFLAAELYGDTTLDNVTSTGTVDFSSACVFGTLEVTNAVLGGLSFADTGFQDKGQLWLEGVTAPSFFIDIRSLPYVKAADASSTVEDRKAALSLLESSAKTSNDLGLANDAHYRLESLKSNGYWEPFHLLDLFFYNWIAGYLVRPDHPLFTLLALALLVALVRALVFQPKPSEVEEKSAVRPAVVARTQRVGSKVKHLVSPFARLGIVPSAGGWLKKTAWPALGDFGHELLDTLKLIWPRTAAAAQGRRFEAFGYRVLFVCMLFGFANSNPTLRQMLDALL